MATPAVMSTVLAVSGVVSGSLSFCQHDPVPRSHRVSCQYAVPQSEPFYDFGILRFWGFGVLGFWGFGVLKEISWIVSPVAGRTGKYLYIGYCRGMLMDYMNYSCCFLLLLNRSHRCSKAPIHCCSKVGKCMYVEVYPQ